MNIIAVVNQKGGVAKTTSVINIGSCLAELGKKVLVVDCDAQGNLTQGLGVDNFTLTTYDCLVKETDIKNVIIPTGLNNLDILPTNINLANAELELSSVLGRETILKDCLEGIKDNYDYILIDCSPSLGLLTVNAIVGCTDIIIPLEPAIFALDGIGQLIKIVNLVKRKLNNDLKIKGVLLTRVDSRTKIAKDFQIKLNEIFNDKVFSTVIHQNIKIADAQIHKQPINMYDKKCNGYKEYLKVTKELINRG